MRIVKPGAFIAAPAIPTWASPAQAGCPVWTVKNDFNTKSGLTGRRKALMEIRQRSYEVTSSSVLLPGEEESLHVVALRPTAKAQSPIGFTGASNPPRATEVEPR